MADSYAGPDFQALGLEMWNGTLSQTNSFLSVTGITYPCLYGGSNQISSSYNCSYDIFFVVGGDGTITFRRNGWNETATRAAIEAALAALTSDVPALERDGFTLDPAFPNPFNPGTTLRYRLAEGGAAEAAVRLRIRDVRGRLLRTLVDESQVTGREYTVAWDGRDGAGRGLASGNYLVELVVGDVSRTRFVTLLK